MAAGDITYGTRTALSNATRLHSIPDGQGRTFGEIQGAGEIGIDIDLVIPINSSAVGGTYDIYVVESQDGAQWTDSIDPTADTGDVAGLVSDARFVASVDTTYNASTRPQAELNFLIPMTVRAQYVGLVVVNNSGQTTPGSGASGNSVTKKVS